MPWNPLDPKDHPFEPQAGVDYCRACGMAKELHEAQVYHDPVNHPRHYTAYKGLEVIDLTEQMNFNRGNAVKYIARAGLKNPTTEVQDLEKARWYIDREIQRLRKAQDVAILSTEEELDRIRKTAKSMLDEGE